MARGQKAEEVRKGDRPAARSEEAFWQFWQQIRRAEAESEALAVGYLVKAMPKTPKAVVDWLERRFRKRWGRSERLEHTGQGGGPIEVETTVEDIIKDTSELAERLFAQYGTPPWAKEGEGERG